MEGFVAWLAELPPVTIYLVIGLATFVENVFPPTPSDVAVALGGFLTHRNPVSPVGVWLVGWLANLAGSVGVYLVARRYGRQFVASRLGRRLLPADAIVGMEREYLRFGMAGIFLSRFLPGFRSFVAAFVGLVSLPPLVAFVPMGLASALWYAGLVWVGGEVGEEWEAINRLLGHLNRTLAIIAAVMVVIILVVLWRRRRRPGRRDRLVRALHRALGSRRMELPEGAGQDPAALGAAALLYELADADHDITMDERNLIAGFLREHWGLGAPAAATDSSPGTADPRTSLPGHLGHTQELAAFLADRYARAGSGSPW